MAKQWHPLLAQFLRQDYGDRLIIEEEVPLGEMPLRVDLLLMPRDPAVSLPFPFNHLGATTLVEFKGPDEVITQGDLVKLEVYGLLYQMKERLWAREELVLWLVGSHFASDVSRVEGAEIVEMVEVGPGVRRGKMDKFPTCLVDVTRLPVGKETLPLVMVTKGQREWEVMEYLVEHREEYGGYLTQALLWHFGVLEEVLKMRGLTVDELGLEMEVDVKGIVNFLGPERILQAMAEEVDVGKVIDSLGRKRILRKMAEVNGEQILQEVVRSLGKERVQQLLAEMGEGGDGSEEEDEECV